MYVNAAMPPDRMRMTLAHELGHLVMDAMTLVSPLETERRATAFAAEFLAPIDDIAFDLDGVSIRTVHELDELLLTWGASVASLVARARERGILSDYQYRSMFRLLNETGRMYGPRPGVADEEPPLISSVPEQLITSGYTTSELDEICLLADKRRRPARRRQQGDQSGQQPALPAIQNSATNNPDHRYQVRLCATRCHRMPCRSLPPIRSRPTPIRVPTRPRRPRTRIT
ncbi:hypothetical protein MDOR_38450 [Mycolicibacterium doricum]|uniref:IrrE N-terminal-like domain-containing protein n=1 Tax=Mycolicibacterium doricum TaxID=126673 RepID=A0A7I7VWK7_9MYCO|nr:ImmA/IrrE family metallo-endopeptidase [Mycolicibacterium doricum]BBZ09676.1 hypothetical protein MDOR_38450 [Mycolicibacterium doricum]